jgi:hypothetical protein
VREFTGSGYGHGFAPNHQFARAIVLADAAPQPNVLLAKVRAILFFAWSFTLALPLFVTMMLLAPFVIIFDKYRWVGW